MELADNVAIITGASSGIGRAAAHNLNEAGVKLILAGRRENRLVELKGRLKRELKPHIVWSTVFPLPWGPAKHPEYQKFHKKCPLPMFADIVFLASSECYQLF